MNKTVALNKYFFKKTGLLAIVFILIQGSVFSQDGWVNSDHKAENLMGLKKGWFVGADFGSNLFYGDVALYNNFPKFKDFSKSFGSGYSFYGGKKFKWGLAAEAQVFKGTLQGQKVAPPLYQRYFKGDVMNYSINLKYNLSQLLFRDKQDRKFYNRLGLFATVGFGQAFFRSRLYKFVGNNWYLEKTTGYTSSGIDSAGQHSAGGLVVNKSKMQSALILPVGGKINFKLNKRTDIVFDLYYVTVFSDLLDSWSRSWSHRDKYFYSGVGLCYNFGRGDDDEVPQGQRILRPKQKKEKVAESSDDSDVKMPGNSTTQRKGLFNKRKSSKEDKDLELKLKLYEIQLKLFEMQFLTK